ncbi:hypothetical protein H4R18_004210 [Coemansia javaensis]|uniref:EngB-type G domain-containing protein n=1 Tax=Coemansia javaensis TaxID=2761396 RepID=A0A9W8LF59_9FUNG|nr:hypothetical protein H4R18_004210 [Coemansia javaensis]
MAAAARARRLTAPIAPCSGRIRLALLHTAARREPLVSTSVQALQESAREPASNRRLFARLRPDPRTMERLDMLGLGSEKRGRFERRRWFRYDEPEVRLPRLFFFAGARAAASFPPASLPEIGFVGRSNVGKSTLVNRLCGSLAARVSERPGLTQQLNFYTAGSDLHLVDMPGYGFAFAKDEEAQGWRALVETYVRQRASLRRVMLLLDARHGIKANDREFIGLLEAAGAKYQLVLTKCDLVHRDDLARQHMLVARQAERARNCIPRVLMVSAAQRAGLNELRKEILHTCSLGQKYLADHRRKEAAAQAAYFEQLRIFNDTARRRPRQLLGPARTVAQSSPQPGQTWEAAHAKNPAFAIERELPAPKSRRREIAIFVAVAAVTWGVGCVVAFNYQRMTSTPVTAALFTARHNDEVCRVLGRQLRFASAFPWISGDISHLKGFVDVEFAVVGDLGVPGRLILKSRRAARQNGEWHTTEFCVVAADGRRIDCSTAA